MLSDFSPEAAGKCGYEPKKEIEYCIGADKAQELCFFPSQDIKRKNPVLMRTTGCKASQTL